MGFDIYGMDPQTEKGHYFRNNVWYWRPLWQLICEECDDILTEEQMASGSYNDGVEVSAEQAMKIFKRLVDKAPEIEDNKGWYHPDDLFPNLPEHYDLILIDGPGGWLGRAGFITYLEYFNTEVPIILDDVHREQELMIIKKLSEILGREYKIINKSLGCIL